MTASEIPIACTLTPAELKERQAGLLQKVSRLVQEVQECEQGYAYRFAPDHLDEVMEVIRLEHRCCAFLRFTLTVEPGDGPIRLEVTGPPGTKEFLADFLR